MTTKTKTATKHTPGPWDWAGQADTRDPHRVFAVLGGTSREIATVGDYDSRCREGWSERNAANARLIAAAPELLDSEREIAGAAVDYAKLLQVENFDRNDIAVHRAYERLRLAIEAARAAIAKAEGGAA